MRYRHTRERTGNLASRIDTALPGPLAYEFDAATGSGHDPEGLLSTFPRVVVGGLVALALGAAWSLVFPLNKNLWTSSFVLWTAGWSLLLLARRGVRLRI